MKKSTNLSTGAVGDTVKNAIRTEYNLSAVPRLVVDWNLNRYTSPTASNTPSDDDEGYDIDRFPIDTIVEPLRPDKGVAKARVNEAVISPGYLKSTDPRFYVSDTEDAYKYWTSPYPTNNAGNFPNHTDGKTSARPRVTYNQVVSTNKIVIKFENTWATPKSYTVWATTSVGGAYTQIGTNNPTINGATGTLTLYYDGSNWVSTRPANLVATNVAGIELRVVSMGPGVKRDGNGMTYRPKGSTNWTLWNGFLPTTGANSSLNVISMEAHYEADLTSRLIEVSDIFDMSDKSQLYPIGTITSNTASVSLSNTDGALNPENPNSPFNFATAGVINYSLIELNAEFNLEYIYTINGVKHSVQQFKMYASNWSNSDGATQVELEDYSKYLKEIKPSPFLVEGKSSTEIVWRVLDSVGFTDYVINSDDLVEDTIIPFFWTTGEETVWEVLDEIAKATQTAIYFDSYGKLQVRTREAAFKDKAVDWNLLGETSGTNLSDILSWSPSGEYEANKIKVNYKSTKWKKNSLGRPAMSKVWEPDGTLVVRSSVLARPIDNSSNFIFLDQKESRFWPFESKVQIDGEIIQYEGKQIVYYTYTENVDSNGNSTYSNETKNTVVIKSADEFKKYNRMTPKRYRHKNRYTGGLKITEREVWNTEKRNHNIDLNGWSTKLELYGKSGSPVQRNDPNGFKLNKDASTVTINTPAPMNDDADTFWAVSGGPASTGYKAYGTRFKFAKDKVSKTQSAGLSYQMSGSREAGYYVEVRTSASLSAARRKNTNEVTVFSRVSGKDTIIAKGSPTAIGEGIWYEMDIYHSPSFGNVQKVSVYINGQLVAQGETTSDTAQSNSGRLGLFARGRTNVDFEYIYAIARDVKEPADNYGFYDLKYGGMRGRHWEREHVWNMRTRRNKIRKNKWKKEQVKHNQYLFDEFVPFVHEVREFDVKFDPAPVRYSYLFSTNEWFAAVPEYTGNPFGAKFIIANVSRDNAILNGEDKLIYAGAGSGVNQVCVVLGQNLEVADEEKVQRKNKPAIRSRGEIEVELSSDWLQTKSAATAVAEWMAAHWSDSVDEVEVSIVGNPLLELGDFVDVSYDREDATPTTHQYFVVGIQTEFNNGVQTTLTLRRKRIATTVS